MLFQWTPTLLNFLPSPPPPSQNNAKGSHSPCVSPSIQYFITTMLQLEPLKPSLLYQVVNTRELCALSLASSGVFCFDSLRNETLGLAKILSPFIKLKYFLPNT